MLRWFLKPIHDRDRNEQWQIDRWPGVDEFVGTRLLPIVFLISVLILLLRETGVL